MAGSGPPPNPNARRRNARVGVVVLPAGGYQGEIPEWPLMDDVVMSAKRDIARRAHEVAAADAEDAETAGARRAAAKRAAAAELDATVLGRQIDAMRTLEVELWRQLWRTPQAAQWARNGWVREVAQYVRHKAKAELGSLDDAKEARMLSDRLGLSPKAMRSLMWTVSDDEVGEKRGEREQTAAAKTPKRPRLVAVDPTGT